MKAKIEVIGGRMDGVETVISNTAFIGRDKNCDVFLPDDRYVSKKHAMLRASKDGYLLEDLSSTNGTFLEEEPVTTPAPLSSGQIFKVGRTTLRINYV